MSFATCPSKRRTSPAVVFWNCLRRSRISSGSSRLASAVEPTRSTNMTVSCRRSASRGRPGSPNRSTEADIGEAEAGLADTTSGWPSIAAIASSIRLRWPSAPTPISFRSSAVRRGRISASIALSSKTGTYCSRPKFLSQTAIFIWPVTAIDASFGGARVYHTDIAITRSFVHPRRRRDVHVPLAAVPSALALRAGLDLTRLDGNGDC
ncbi:hypothetical protein BQ8794_30096 [Mesorhizobium prunaredense]|uniref:Uncharacterized protein n=1 Tax=Mesorhizobium prunaredense TaxID=1631249 RepID=A0A1R3V9Q2_9HYPH|nr:hypothetical protein BQ8794_30096 [Mesorhizobium prunaredense]